ncbi:MAG TPA: VOC family protein, partial [Luteimonas sp.]|nr:VOC family protein [Luteimonas sp.]
WGVPGTWGPLPAGNLQHGIDSEAVGLSPDSFRPDPHREGAETVVGLLVNVDVSDIEAAARFYCAAFQLDPGRRLGPGVLELVGATARIYLLEKAAGSRACHAADGRRAYSRHWTPIHLDFVVDDLDAALARSMSAGGLQEHPIREHAWGRIAVMSDPFGHGYCLIQFSAAGYDAIAAPA